MRVETIQSKEQGALTIKHDLSLDRLFRYSRDLKAADVLPGEKFRIRLYSVWAFGGGWRRKGGSSVKSSVAWK